MEWKLNTKCAEFVGVAQIYIVDTIQIMILVGIGGGGIWFKPEVDIEERSIIVRHIVIH